MKSILGRMLVLNVLLLSAVVSAPALEPANPQANAKARAILNYFQGLGSRAEKRLVSGQFAGAGRTTTLRLTDEIHDQTGQWPALMGTDYVDYSNGSLTTKAPNQAAIQYWNQGGLVTLSTHLYNPANPKGGGLRDQGVDPATITWIWWDWMLTRILWTPITSRVTPRWPRLKSRLASPSMDRTARKIRRVITITGGSWKA